MEIVEKFGFSTASPWNSNIRTPVFIHEKVNIHFLNSPSNVLRHRLPPPCYLMKIRQKVQNVSFLPCFCPLEPDPDVVIFVKTAQIATEVCLSAGGGGA